MFLGKSEDFSQSANNAVLTENSLAAAHTDACGRHARRAPRTRSPARSTGSKGEGGCGGCHRIPLHTPRNMARRVRLASSMLKTAF